MISSHESYDSNLLFRLPVAKWLSSEVLKLLKSGAFASLLLSMSRRDPASSRLSPIHEHLVGVVCRLPDVLANRLGRQLKEGLFPAPYFRQLGRDLLECLESIHVKWKGTVEPLSKWTLWDYRNSGNFYCHVIFVAI